MNFVMEAGSPLVAQNPEILLIAGIPWYAFVMLVLIFLLMGIIMFILGKQRLMFKKHREEVRGKVILAVLPTTGGTIPIEFELCRYHKGEARKPEDTSSATFTMPAWADAPPGHTNDRYLLPDEYDYCMYWPIWAPAIEQVIAPVYIVRKNFEMPECPHDAAKWNENRRIQVSASMNALAKQESTLQALMSPSLAMSEQLRVLADKMKWVMFAFFTSAGTAVFELILIIFMFLNYSRINDIAKFLTGG